MKNSIIKKSLALVLVGAMAFATPITSSASPITDAYNTDTTDGSDKDTSTSTGTGTSTSTSTSTNTNSGSGEFVDVPIPEAVKDIQLNVLGITLDKDNIALDLDAGKTTENLQARVLFDAYNPEKEAEEMDWAKVEEVITKEQKEAIESQIQWYCYDNSVATVAGSATKAVVSGVADGQTTVVAYLENDGVAYKDKNGNYAPTDGDFVAYASVTVTQYADAAELTLKGVYQKHTYNLKDYTNLVFGETRKSVYDCTEDVIYSGLKISNTKTTKATLKNDGTLKITKGKFGDTISFTMTTSNGAKSTATVTVQQDVPVKSLMFVDDKDQKITKGVLDLGSNADKDWYRDLTVKATTDGGKQTTDEITWTISDKKGTIAVMTDFGDIKDNCTWVTVNATGEKIGTVKITAKSTSGKSASFSLTINATPARAEIYGPESIYTGKTGTMTALLYGENGMVIPQGKTTFKWSVSVTGNKANTKINSSKGVLTPATLITKGSGKSKEVMPEDTATVKATFSNSTAKIKNKAVDNTADVKIIQTDLKDVTLYAEQYSSADGECYPIGNPIAGGDKNAKADLKGLVVGSSFNVIAVPGAQSTTSADSIAWSTTGKGIYQEVYGDTAVNTITATGNKTVKATYYSVDWTKKKATKVVKTYNIKNLVVRAEKLTFDKSAVVVSPTTKATTVTLKIKAQAPKGAADKITWGVKAADADGKELTLATKTSGKLQNQIKITLPAGLAAGSVVKVGAFAESGAVEYAYIYVTEKTNKVLSQVDKNKTSVAVGETTKVTPMLEVINGKTKENKTPGLVNWSKGSTTAYFTEPVTYSVDAKSAKYVKIDQDGCITGLQKGTAKVTIKTISGKKATVKVTVKE